jgi:agmatinase
MKQSTAQEYIRHGQTPFFRLPMRDASKLGRDAYQGLAAVVLGVPYDGGTTYQPGARLGPYHVRRTSALIHTYHPAHRADVFGAVHTADGGNVAVSPFDRAFTEQAIYEEVGLVASSGVVPFVVGGDHSVALPAMRAVARAHGPLAVIHVDAHLDTSGPEVWGEAFHHGTPMRHALLEGIIARDKLFQVGIRATWGSAEEGSFGADHGAQVFPMTDAAVRGLRSVAAEIREAIGALPAYLSFDVDAVDPAFAPGTGTPVVGGMSSREALELIRGLAGVRLVGMDLVEVAPALDHADMTCHLAAQLLFEGLALLAPRVRERVVVAEPGSDAE